MVLTVLASNVGAGFSTPKANQVAKIINPITGRKENITATSLLNPSQVGQFRTSGSGLAGIQSTLSNMRFDSRRNEIIQAALSRLQLIGRGERQPKEDFEFTGGFLQAQGLPYKIEFGDDGKIKVIDQSSDDNAFPLAQRKIASRAIKEIEDAVKEDDFQRTKKNLRLKLQFFTGVRLAQLSELKATPENAEENEAVSLYSSGIPFTVNLDDDGNITFRRQDQYYLSDDTNILRKNAITKAARELKAHRDGSDVSLKTHIIAAAGFADKNTPFSFHVDDFGNITAERISANNSIPDFLKKTNDEDDLPNKKYIRDAVLFAREEKGYHLEFFGSQIRATENTLFNTLDLDNPLTNAERLQGALLTLLA